MVRTSLWNCGEREEMCASSAVVPRTANITATVRAGATLGWNRHCVWVEDVNTKCVLINGNTLCLKVLSLHKDFNKRAPETSDTKSFTASNGWLHRLNNRFELKNVIAREA